MAFCEGRSSLHLARFSSKGKSASAGRSPPEALPDHTLPAKEPAFLSTSFLTHIFTVTQSLRFSPQVPKGIDYISSHLYFAEVSNDGVAGWALSYCLRWITDQREISTPTKAHRNMIFPPLYD